MKIDEALLSNIGDLTSYAFAAYYSHETSYIKAFFDNQIFKDKPLSVVYVPSSQIVLINNIVQPLHPDTFRFYPDYRHHSRGVEHDQTTLSVLYAVSEAGPRSIIVALNRLDVDGVTPSGASVTIHLDDVK